MRSRTSVSCKSHVFSRLPPRIRTQWINCGRPCQPGQWKNKDANDSDDDDNDDNGLMFMTMPIMRTRMRIRTMMVPMMAMLSTTNRNEDDEGDRITILTTSRVTPKSHPVTPKLHPVRPGYTKVATHFTGNTQVTPGLRPNYTW